MLYKALGYVVWNLGMKYLRRRYGRYRKPVAALTVVTAIAVIYVATRGDE